MKAELKRLHSPDAPNLNSFWPEDESTFGLLIQAMIGPVGENSEESYELVVCTPRWFEQEYLDSKAIFGRGFLFVSDYSLDQIEEKISRFCSECEGETWQQVSAKLARIGRSEFEDYRQSEIRTPDR